ncbi:hypothetical protein Ddye_005660 [Dipteronia dyeriana]|uniref:hypoxanthine phosphoribosyltransferase n=1 Tax=Dipteronia dyeriana TaxID=168575 RepID=A0AAE0CPW7_9ROSI|nr:hypothetical protein Ddye_005660 [Dipteronia dyeriana]
MSLNSHIETVLWTHDQISDRVAELAAQISTDFHSNPASPPVVVGVATGAFLFLADLVRKIQLPVSVDFVRVESYGSGTESNGAPVISLNLKLDVKDKHVILVEDIVDTGSTVSCLIPYLESKGASSVSVCTFLDKPTRRKVQVELLGKGKFYRGFQCPDYFVVGYGMDYAELYRNLPYIGVLKPEYYNDSVIFPNTYSALSNTPAAMKKTGKLLDNLSKFVSSSRATYPSRLVRPLSTTTNRGAPFEENKHSNRESVILEKFRLRKLKGSAKTDAENKPLPNSSNSNIQTQVGSDNEMSCGTAEVVSSFQKLGLREEIVRAAEEMDVFVPSEIQCVGVPAVLDGKSLILSSASGSGRTLAWLLPLVQMLRSDEALLAMKPKHPRAIVLCSTEESADQGFRTANFISHYARLNSSKGSGSDSSKTLEDASDAPIGMLVGTPSEVIEHIEEGNICCDDIKYMALDEADALFDHGFGPTISKIFSRIKSNKGIQTIFVTSTIAEMLGEQLSSLMEHLEHDNAGKVTAVLLEMDQTEVFHVIESTDGLKKKVAQAMNSLHVAALGFADLH